MCSGINIIFILIIIGSTLIIVLNNNDKTKEVNIEYNNIIEQAKEQTDTQADSETEQAKEQTDGDSIVLSTVEFNKDEIFNKVISDYIINNISGGNKEKGFETHKIFYIVEKEEKYTHIYTGYMRNTV